MRKSIWCTDSVYHCQVSCHPRVLLFCNFWNYS